MSTPVSVTSVSETPVSETPVSETPRSEDTKKTQAPLVQQKAIAANTQAKATQEKATQEKVIAVKDAKEKAIEIIKAREENMKECPKIACPIAPPCPKPSCSCPVQDTQPYGRYIYSIFHTIMSITAIYLSFRCNKGFDIGSFMLALCCPYIYIIYIFATKGTCGIITNESSFMTTSKT